MVILDKIRGHNDLKQRLINSASKHLLASTHIFVGPGGIGKKQVALGLAQTLLCEKPSDNGACGSCGSCLRVNNQQHESLLVIHPEKHQIKIDQARSVVEFTHLRSVRNASVIIIDGVESMNVQAANALLKILEEPGQNVYFFMICKSLGSLLPTIRSRSQVWHFQPLSSEVMKDIERFPDWILMASQGSLETARSLASEDDNDLRPYVFNMLKGLIDKKTAELLEETRKLLGDKGQVVTVSRLWQQFARDAIVYKVKPEHIIHRDYHQVLAMFQDFSFAQLEELFGLGQELERAYYRHWDLNITADHLVYSGTQLLRGNVA